MCFVLNSVCVCVCSVTCFHHQSGPEHCGLCSSTLLLCSSVSVPCMWRELLIPGLSSSALLHLFAKSRPCDGFEMNTVPGINELLIFHSASTHQPVVSNVLLKLRGNHSILFRWRIIIPMDMNWLQRLAPTSSLVLIWEIVLRDLKKPALLAALTDKILQI